MLLTTLLFSTFFGFIVATTGGLFVPSLRIATASVLWETCELVGQSWGSDCATSLDAALTLVLETNPRACRRPIESDLEQRRSRRHSEGTHRQPDWGLSGEEAGGGPRGGTWSDVAPSGWGLPDLGAPPRVLVNRDVLQPHA